MTVESRTPPALAVIGGEHLLRSVITRVHEIVKSVREQDGYQSWREWLYRR